MCCCTGYRGRIDSRALCSPSLGSEHIQGLWVNNCPWNQVTSNTRLQSSWSRKKLIWTFHWWIWRIYDCLHHIRPLANTACSWVSNFKHLLSFILLQILEHTLQVICKVKKGCSTVEWKIENIQSALFPTSNSVNYINIAEDSMNSSPTAGIGTTTHAE